MTVSTFNMPYRISKACIYVPHVLSWNIGNIATTEMQEKLFHLKNGDLFEVKGLGTLKVEAINIWADQTKERQFRYEFNFRIFDIECKFI